MKRFPGIVDGRDVVIEGEDFKDAMEKAGYLPMTKYRSGRRFVGKLVDGRRYLITYQPLKQKSPTSFLKRDNDY